jgi:hypothetical protein
MDSTNAVNPSENNGSPEAESDDSAKQASADYAAIAAAPSYDEHYRFGRQPTSRAPFPFTEREFARLLIVRGRIQSQRPTFNPAEA